MTVTAASFRTNYPEFGNTSTYPDSQITYWLNYAVLNLNADRFGSMLDLATELYIAHNIALEARAQAESTNGEIPGTTTGAVSSKSVDKVSVGFDTDAGKEEGAGHWNTTIYGSRLFKLMKLAGLGPLQVGVSVTDVQPFSSNSAFGGPWASLVPNTSG